MFMTRTLLIVPDTGDNLQPRLRRRADCALAEMTEFRGRMFYH